MHTHTLDGPTHTLLTPFVFLMWFKTEMSLSPNHYLVIYKQRLYLTFASYLSFFHTLNWSFLEYEGQLTTKYDNLFFLVCLQILTVFLLSNESQIIFLGVMVTCCMKTFEVSWKPDWRKRLLPQDSCSVTLLDVPGLLLIWKCY